MAEGSDWVVVLSTYNQADIALAKHILAREDRLLRTGRKLQLAASDGLTNQIPG